MTNKITLAANEILAAANVKANGSVVRQYVIDHYAGVYYDSAAEFVSDLHWSFLKGSIDLTMSDVAVRNEVYKYYEDYKCSFISFSWDEIPIEDMPESKLLAIACNIAANDIAEEIEIVID